MDLYSINYKNIDAYSKIIHVGDIVCYGFRQCLGKIQGHLVANQQHFRCLRPPGLKSSFVYMKLKPSTYWHCVLHQCSTSLQELILSIIQGNRVGGKSRIKRQGCTILKLFVERFSIPGVLVLFE